MSHLPDQPSSTASVWLIVLHGHTGFFAIHRREVTALEFAGILRRIASDLQYLPERSPLGSQTSPRTAAAYTALPDSGGETDDYVLAYRSTEQAAQKVAAALRDALPHCRIPLPPGAFQTILRVAEYRLPESP